MRKRAGGWLRWCSHRVMQSSPKDLKGVITNWNAGAERLFGFEADEIIGQPITTIIPPHLHAEEPHILERIRRGEMIDHYETVRRRRDGKLLNVSLTVSPIRDQAMVRMRVTRTRNRRTTFPLSVITAKTISRSSARPRRLSRPAITTSPAFFPRHDGEARRRLP